MIAVSERRSRPLFRPESPAPPPEPARPCGWWRYVAALLLGGYLLFAHGCHGDEDNELFARWGSLSGGRGSRRAALSSRLGGSLAPLLCTTCGGYNIMARLNIKDDP
jgi:hypothetical protein